MSRSTQHILKRVVVDELYSAVTRYVERHGGEVVVISGIELQAWPNDRKMNFSIAVHCTGRKPDVNDEERTA